MTNIKALTYKGLKILIWPIIILIGVFAVTAIAIKYDESINSLWIITAAICVYLIFYRFYSAFIAAKILAFDSKLQTPAYKFKDGRDYEPTNKWVLFGHHFAAIAGPGPLIGPTLAAQFGYLPGVLWILIGSVIGGCVQDMVILFYSVRHNGKSLSSMAKDELGKIGGIAAIVGTLMIMVILIAVLGLVVVNAMKHSAWATSTVFATIPIAIIIGIYMRYIRPGAVLEASLIGITLLLSAVIGGEYIQKSELLNHFFNYDAKTLAWIVIAYGFTATILPIWLLLAPRDYLSSFLKLGTIILLAAAIIILHPELKMPPLTKFIDGTGPIFAGKIFPFVFITIACGAISGFHSLIASGTTPKLIENEKDIRFIGYGAMTLESLVAIMALIAASIMEPGVFFAINSPISAVGKEATEIVAKINSWGFAVTVEQMEILAKQVGEETLFNRTGGAPSLAVGMASVFANLFGNSLLAVWYHFVIMFEAVFILTTLDAGTRVCRFMIQDILGNFSKTIGDTSHYPSIVITSFIAVASWGYFLYAGVIDPNGGVNMLWPLFGMSNQILAAIALSIATVMICKSGKIKYCWITLIPLIWLTTSTLTAAWQKLTSDNIRIGILSNINHLKSGIQTDLTSQLIFNQYVVATLTAFFASILIIVILDTTQTILKQETMLKKLKYLYWKLNGDLEYQKYLQSNHHDHKPLNKKDFFLKKEQEKWGKINRCC